jgi:hypothetical protein
MSQLKGEPAWWGLKTVGHISPRIDTESLQAPGNFNYLANSIQL